MSRLKDYDGKCATCKNYALGSRAQLKPGVGFRCSKYGEAKSMSDYCNSHFIMAGYDYNRNVTEKDIMDAEKMINSSSNCFITTIVVHILGYMNIHYVLELLRNFRDNIMQPNPEYHMYLKNYDIIGPKIANCIENDLNREEIAIYVYDNYLINICKFIESNYYDEAIELYVQMTDFLANLYNIENVFDVNAYYTKDEIKSAGHGRVLKKD